MLLVGLLACRKDRTPYDGNQSMENLQVPASFNWETTKKVQLSVYSEYAQIIRVKSEDQKIVYHKGYFNRLEEAYTLQLTIPSLTEKLWVNGKIVSVLTDVVDVYLDQAAFAKESVAFYSFPEGLIAYWPFDEASGTIVSDVMGNAHGVYSSGKWETGIKGSAVKLDGLDARVEVPNSQQLNLTGDAMSVSLWFSRLAAGKDSELLFYRNKFVVRIDKNGKITFAVYTPGWKSAVTSWSDRIIDNDWHHIGASYDGQILKVFIDGVLKVSVNNSGNLQNSNADLLIGSQFNNNFFNGLIDEVMLFNRALSAEEFQNLMEQTNDPGMGDELIASWKLDEGSGTTISDATGNYPGTAVNTVWVDGVIGKALDFNGSNSNITISNQAGLNPDQQITIMAWVNTRENKTTKIAQKGDWDGHGLGQGKWDGFNGHIRCTDQLTHSVNWGNGLPVYNQWYHLAMTYDGATLRLYVNGQLANERYIGQQLHVNGRPFSIGSDNNAQKHFNGMIDEVMFFGKALQPIEIQSLMHQAPALDDADGDGIPDADDDYPNDPSRAFFNVYPAEGTASLAFEDLWPGKGDYDFNDLVADYQFTAVTNSQNKLTELKARFVVRANGAGFENGFGFQLPSDIPLNDVQAEGYKLSENYIQLDENGLESDQDVITVIVFDNIKTILQSPSGFGANVLPDAIWVEPDTIDVILTFTPDLYELSHLQLDAFNPFLIVNKNRGHEIHLPDFPPTALADVSLFGSVDDDSNPGLNRYYKTKQNLPWAIRIASSFDYTVESSQIIEGHLKFAEWAESGGMQYPDWYLDLTGYRNSLHIYVKP